MPEKVRFIASLFSTSPPPPKNNTDVDWDKLEQKDMFWKLFKTLLFDKTTSWGEREEDSWVL